MIRFIGQMKVSLEDDRLFFHLLAECPTNENFARFVMFDEEVKFFNKDFSNFHPDVKFEFRHDDDLDREYEEYMPVYALLESEYIKMCILKGDVKYFFSEY